MFKAQTIQHFWWIVENVPVSSAVGVSLVGRDVGQVQDVRLGWKKEVTRNGL